MSNLTKYIKTLIFFFYSFLTLSATAQVPVINSFSPASGAIGSSITITGSNFNATPANNIVSFGSIRAVVTTASSTSLTVTVPAGAGYDPISVIINGLTTFSSIPYITTFAGGGSVTSNSFQYGYFPYPPGEYVRPRSVAVSDMDGDGRSDIGFFDVGEMPSLVDTIAIFRNTSSNGTISHAPKFRIITGNNSHELMIIYFSDIDGDGKPDIIALNPSGYFSIFRNTSTPGNLSFENPVPVDLAGQHGLDAVFGDFDNDGKPDIAMKVSGNVLNIYKNVSSPGNIIINQSPIYSIPSFSQLNIKTADIDADNKIDIVTTTPDETNISILRNTSSGATISFTTTNLPIPGTIGVHLFISDLDGDQKQEIIAMSYGPTNLAIFRNTSSAGALSFATRDDRPIYISYINDMDGDGKPDLLSRVGMDSMGIFKNTSAAGVISFANNVNFASAPSGVFASIPKIVYDIDNDGRGDIIAANASDFETWFSLVRNRTGAPQITSFTPKRGVTDTTVIITGYNFTGASSVSFGNTPDVSFNVLSATSISAIAAAGSAGKLFVTTQYGTDSSEIFNTPVINSFTPHLAGPGSADSVVNIFGYNFTGATSVTLGTIPASSFTIISDSQIRAITATSSFMSGYSYVSVTSLYGTGSKIGFYYYGAFIAELCPPTASTVLNSDVIIPGATYHWQVQTGGINYSEVINGPNYSGSNTTSLHLINIPSSQYGYRYRCATGNLGSSNQVSTVHLIKFVSKWTGAVNSAWENPANWSCGTVPDNNTYVVINSGAVVTLNSNTTIRSLYISPGATLTIAPGYNLTVLH